MHRARLIVRGTASAGAIGIALTASAFPGTGCTTHQCDASSADFYGGRMLDENTFETNAIDEAWIEYPGNVLLRVHYPMDMGRPMAWISPFVGISQHPNAPDSNFTLASGGLAEYSVSDSKGVSVLNTTCASYFARFVVHFPPLSATDGGTLAPQDSSSADAGVD